MKKYIAFFLSLLMILTFTSCEKVDEERPFKNSQFLGVWSSTYYEIGEESKYDSYTDEHGKLSYELKEDGSCLITQEVCEDEEITKDSVWEDEITNTTWKENEKKSGFIVILGTDEMEFLSMDETTFVYESEDTCILVEKQDPSENVEEGTEE